MNTTIIILIVSIFLTLIVTIVVYILATNLKETRYNSERSRIQLESIRANLEKQMYNINDRLILNEERWRDVNHLLLRDEYLINDLSIKNEKTHYTDFLKANGITENDLQVDSRLIFVLTPFHDEHIGDFHTIRDVCASAGYKCVRGDEHYFQGDIFSEMLKLIGKSNLIIANISGRNPNVFYELGIAQAMDKPVVLVSRKPEDLPIDIKSRKFLVYSNQEELTSLLRDLLLNIPNK